MLARLLYSAVALCVLGTLPEHGGTRSAPPAEAAAPAPAAATAIGPDHGAASGVGGTPADFAIPRNSR